MTQAEPVSLPQEIEINGRKYVQVKLQRAGESAVYKSMDTYARLGTPEKISADFVAHKRMQEYGFPVPIIIEEGQIGAWKYFIETSFGESHFSQIFAKEIEQAGTISDETFDRFIAVSRTFAVAQLSTASDQKNFDAFAHTIHIDTVKLELPEYAEVIDQQFAAIKQHLAQLPFVITHGDFNPHNMYPDGVIDFETAAMGPIGYDLITAIDHIVYFPDSKDYEYYKGYDFTEDQRGIYLKIMDTVFLEHHLPALSSLRRDFAFCRATWMVANMHRFPKIQQFRYDLFKKQYLR